VRELGEPVQGFTRDVLGELDRADDIVPVVVEWFAPLVADVGDGSNGVLHEHNLLSERTELRSDIAAKGETWPKRGGIVGRSQSAKEINGRTDVYLRHDGGG
jgi:hypothetical protein